MRRPPRPFRREILDLLWQQPLWALPFTLFFSVLYARTWASVLKVFEISLIFSFFVRFGLMAVQYLVLPRLNPRTLDPFASPRALPTRGLLYGAGAIVASYFAALIVHLWVLHPFLGDWQQAAGTGMFALLFTALFSGIAYARTFYQQALDRARAAEQARAERTEAELAALRARIHPHFLFNTLNTIASLIGENPAAAEETTTRLAEVFRYALAASERSHAPLRDELAFVRDCLEIERTRFGERLRVEEAIEPGVEDLSVPTLLLQPLVENAIQHGIATRPGVGTVRIAATRSGDRLVIDVEDDGPGFDASVPPRGTGFGLRSVRERLRLAGPPHALEIETRPGGGTRARIVLPAAAGPVTVRPHLPLSEGDPPCCA